MTSMKNKVALITGASRGIGRAIGEALGREGATVAINYRSRPEEAEEAVRAVEQAGGIARAFHGDVAEIGDITSLFDAVTAAFGGLDIVIANAGVVRTAPFPTISEEHFDREIDTNVRGVFFTVQKALPLMPDGGSIVLMSSIANVKGFPLFSLYAGTKAAVRSFARSWTSELAERNIRVNTISPGPIDTPLPSKLGLPEDALAATLEGFAAQVPLGRRLGHADEVAKAALFLASDDSSFVTGIDLAVDGGIAQVWWRARTNPSQRRMPVSSEES